MQENVRNEAQAFHFVLCLFSGQAHKDPFKVFVLVSFHWGWHSLLLTTLLAKAGCFLGMC